MKVVLMGLLMALLCLEPLQAKAIDRVLFDDVHDHLATAINGAAEKQSMFSYNIANASTPGFRPVLSPEDSLEFRNLVPANHQDSDIMIEYFMAKLTENRSHQSAYIKLFTTKMGILRQVATLGKR
ncbi:MAG: flagellar basal body protein [Candidatus Margulisiibacteriota bacterium]